MPVGAMLIHIWDKNDFDQKINLLYQGFQEIEPKINFSKTERMIWNRMKAVMAHR